MNTARMTVEECGQEIHSRISMTLKALAMDGFAPMDVNAVMLGMVRRSSEDIVGLRAAIIFEENTQKRWIEAATERQKHDQ